MSTAGFKPNVVAYTAVIKGLSNAGRIADARATVIPMFFPAYNPMIFLSP